MARVKVVAPPAAPPVAPVPPSAGDGDDATAATAADDAADAKLTSAQKAQKQQQQQIDDRVKLVAFEQEREDRLRVLDEEVQTAAANGKIMDPDEVQRERKAIAAIGKDDPATKRAPGVFETVELKDPKNHHYKRKMGMLFVLTAVMVIVSLLLQGGPGGGAAPTIAPKVVDGTEAPVAGASGTLMLVAGVFFLLGWAIAGARVYSHYKRAKEPESEKARDLEREKNERKRGKTPDHTRGYNPRF
jgi:hypothetical protein